MARTTAIEVKDIIETSLKDSEIETYITTANLQITDELGDSDLSEDKLTEIEKYLTAHLIASTRERQPTREEIDNARIDYVGSFGKYLEMTSYGQMVTVMDTTGKLAEAGKRKAGIWSVDSKY